jgi:hypothetical protein
VDEHDRLAQRLVELDRLTLPADPGFPTRVTSVGDRIWWFAVTAVAAAALIAFIVVQTIERPGGVAAPSPTSPGPSLDRSAPPTLSPSVTNPSASPTTSPEPTPTPPRSIPPKPTLPAGQCTSPRTTARELIDNYLGLTTSGDTDAVRDCFSAEYLAANGFNGRWATAGPVSGAAVTYRYPLRGCQWFEVRADFAGGSPDAPAQGGTTYFRFLAVGRSADGSLRIRDQATALTRPEFENDPSVPLPSCAP